MHRKFSIYYIYCKYLISNGESTINSLIETVNLSMETYYVALYTEKSSEIIVCTPKKKKKCTLLLLSIVSFIHETHNSFPYE